MSGRAQALIGMALLSAWLALRDSGRVLEPEEKSGTSATSPLAAGNPVR